jgi:hypothetical protein
MPTLRKTLTIDEFLTRAGVAINNARQTPEIAAALAGFGYDEARLEAGAELLADAEARQAAQKQEYGDQYQATAALQQAQAEADQLYEVHRKLAQVALKKVPKQQESLGLGQPKKHSLSGWLGQATIFYTNALNDPEVQAALARFNITPEALQQGQVLVQQVVELNGSQEREKYQAQQATKDRDAALDRLDDWLGDFKEVAVIALASQPQQLEALQFGVVA